MKTRLLFVLTVLLHGLALLPVGTSPQSGGGAVLWLIPQAAAQASPSNPRPPAAAALPEVLDATFRYTHRGEEEVGTVNVPLCQVREWQATLKLKMRRKRTTAMAVEYEVVRGEWDVEGTCTGTMTWEIVPSPSTCTWTIEGRLGGSGTFPSSQGGVNLTLHPATGTFTLGFGLVGGEHQNSWAYNCNWNANGQHSGVRRSQAISAGMAEGRYTLRGKDVIHLDGGRQWDNPNYASAYTSLVSGHLGSDREPVTVAIEGPRCGCINAEDLDGASIRFTAAASEPGGTFTRFTVQSAGQPPREVVNDGGGAPRLELAPTREAGAVILSIAYEKDGETYEAEPFPVEWCVMDPIQFAGGSTDLSFDTGYPARLAVNSASAAWHNGQEVTSRLQWTLERIQGGTKLSPSEATGGEVEFVYEGLPEFNGAFGEKMLSAVVESGGCRCERTEIIRVFFPALARNHPHVRDGPGTPYGNTPNWYYYWTQTTAQQKIGMQYLRHRSRFPPNEDGTQAAAKFDGESDRITLTDLVVLSTCKERIDRATRAPTGEVARGIDCFGETLRHEWQHRVDWQEWWPNGYSRFEDTDGDFVPGAVEATLPGCKESGLLGSVVMGPTQMTCDDRPFPNVLDTEVNAYWVGWTWPLGSADKEDWSCGGKQWQGGECPS